MIAHSVAHLVPHDVVKEFYSSAKETSGWVTNIKGLQLVVTDWYSGHAISGLANFELPSLIAVFGFFAGGLAATYFILPYLL